MGSTLAAAPCRSASAAPRSFRRRRRGHRPARRSPPRTAAYPAPELVAVDIPEHIAVAQLPSPARTRGSSWPRRTAAKPGSRIDSGGGDDGLGRLADVGRQALVALSRGIRAWPAPVVSQLWPHAAICRAAWLSPTQRPSKNVARAAALQERGNAPGSARLARRSPCSVSMVSATRSRPSQHSLRRRASARTGAEVPGSYPRQSRLAICQAQKLGGDDGGRRDQAGEARRWPL